ncbi:MAG: tetratricopeptide repeat protein [Acidobacteriota bacterium]
MLSSLARTAILALVLCSISLGQSRSRLDEITQTYFNQGQYAQAADAYEKLLDKTADAPTRVEIGFNLGKAFQMLREYDKSVESFKELLLMNIDKDAPVEAQSDYRQALWEIGNSFFGQGDYAMALEAYRTSREKFSRRRESCGIRDFRNETVEGITLERLGRFNEAIPLYLKADDTHLAELYYSSGQLEDLRDIVSAINEPVIAEGMRKYAWTREKSVEGIPLRNLKAALDIYDAEKAEAWSPLIGAAYQFANSREFGRNNIAVSVLARHMDKALPLLKEEVRKQLSNGDIGVIYEALASSQNPEAMKFLIELIQKNGIHWDNALILICTLDRAGDKGKVILDGLETADKTHNLGIARSQQREGRDDRDRFGRFEVKFPVIEMAPRLPRKDELPK